MRILLIEDDESLAEVVSKALTEQHYRVETVTDGQTGWEMAEAFEYELILLDVMLPGLDGIRFCQKLRSEHDRPSPSPNSRTPILLMTAQENSTDIVIGLDAGADDYLVKPFDVRELLARVRALLRRAGLERSPLLTWGRLQLDPGSCIVSYNGQVLQLTAKEYGLLELFLRRPQQIFSHNTLIEHLWTLDDIPTDNAIRAHIKGLRKKLKQAGAGDAIATVYGLGYRLREGEMGRKGGGGDEEDKGDKGDKGAVLS
ncbi:MAG: response regulator transcription factor, partial [Leptolyngbyaceae cyanobacterium RU_5_1]|nr:response regulator transcription factor [Leptolyngbyaceae cyanobacterium RU_5_1]